jgi:hypothetical protein
VADYPNLASHESNVEYYSNFLTVELERFLPQAESDHEDTRRRLAAIKQVLLSRRDG